jgi:hypothetical protein
MYNKAQLNKDRKDASKPRTLAKPKDIDYVSKMGYRDDSPFNNRSYIDINTPNGSIDMSNTGIDLIANGRFLPAYSGIHQFDTTTVREIPAAENGGEYMDLTEDEIAEYRRGGYVVEELPKAQTGATTGPTPPVAGDPDYDRKLKAYNRYLVNVESIGPELALKTYKASACFADYCPPAAESTTTSGFVNGPAPDQNADPTLEYVGTNQVVKAVNENDPYGATTTTTEYLYKKKEEPPVEEIKLTPKEITEQNLIDAFTPTEPEMAWIKQYHKPEKNVFGKPKKGQKGYWEEKQVPADSKEAGRWFQQNDYSPESVAFFQKYPQYYQGRQLQSDGSYTAMTKAIGEIPEWRQFKTEGAFPYGYGPSTTTPEQLATEVETGVRKEGGYVSKQMVHFLTGGAYEEPLPKAQKGDQIYTYAARPEAKYKKDSKGNWLISLPSTNGKYVPIEDPSGKRAGELNEKAKPVMDATNAFKTVANASLQNKINNLSKEEQHRALTNYRAGWSDYYESLGDYLIEKKRLAKDAKENPLVFDPAKGKYVHPFEGTAANNYNDGAIQSVDWVWGLPIGLPAITQAMGAIGAMSLPGMASIPGATVGNLVNSAFIANSLFKAPGNAKEWYDVSQGKKDWKDAALGSAEIAAGLFGSGAGWKSLVQDSKALGKTVASAPSSKVLLQSAEKRLGNPTAYELLQGQTKGVRGTIAEKYYANAQANLVKQENKLMDKVFKARQSGNNELADDLLSQIDKLRDQGFNIEKNFANWRLKYSGLPIQPTGMGGGQGSLYSLNSDPDQLLKIGKYFGDEASLNNLIEVGKNYNYPGAQIAFPTRQVPLSQGEFVQFMPKLNFNSSLPSNMTIEDLARLARDLDKKGVGIDYRGVGNIGSVDNNFGLVDLTYVGKPGARTKAFEQNAFVFDPSKSRYGFRLKEGGSASKPANRWAVTDPRSMQVDNYFPKLQDGGNTDPGNNALELHMFYDKDVYKQDGGEIDYLTDQEIEALREQGFRVDIE